MFVVGFFCYQHYRLHHHLLRRTLQLQLYSQHIALLLIYPSIEHHAEISDVPYKCTCEQLTKSQL